MRETIGLTFSWKLKDERKGFILYSIDLYYRFILLKAYHLYLFAQNNKFF